jgi:hypothetical protein
VGDVHIGVIPASRRYSSIDIAIFELGESFRPSESPDTIHNQACNLDTKYRALCSQKPHLRICLVEHYRSLSGDLDLNVSLFSQDTLALNMFRWDIFGISERLNVAKAQAESFNVLRRGDHDGRFKEGVHTYARK